MNYSLVGSYKHFATCRFCSSKNVSEVLNLGYMPLAGGFIKRKTSLQDEKKYPLVINFCKDCFLLQCADSISPETLFKDYFYFSSSIKTLVAHFQQVVSEIKQFTPKKKAFVVEIGCNDGEFIKSLEKANYKAIGVDPAENVTSPLIKKGLPIINDFFSDDLAQKIVRKYGQADAIYSFHTMAHIEDMHSVFRGIKKLLKKDGYLAFEVHYLGDLISGMQYDMIYHEHQFYYSLRALQNVFKQYDMEIFDVKRIPVRAGSIMYFVQHKKGGRKISKSVLDLVKLEKQQKLDKIATYQTFLKKINTTKTALLQQLIKLKKQKKKIVGYGASGRGTVIMNYCNLTSDLLDYVVDDAKAKQGSFMPGTHQKIEPSRKMLADNTQCAVLFAWPFVEEVIQRNQDFIKKGGKFITPLPHVRVLPK